MNTPPQTHPHLARAAALFGATFALASLAACGGGGGGTATATPAPTPVAAPAPAPTPTPAPAPVANTPVSSYPLNERAGVLVQKWGKSKRLLVGLGGNLPVSSVQNQALTPDIYEHYLVGLGNYTYSWDQWNSPRGAYVGIHATRADQLGAIPMFTLYQMASWGDGNLYGLSDKVFMTNYWDNVRLMFQQIKAYGKTTLVNFEPDFWGYVQQHYAERYGASSPTAQLAYVQAVNPDCANQPDTVAGMGQCLVQMARALAPNAYVGFPPSMFGDLVTSEEITFMKAVGADKADFVVMQTLDRDAGCFEAAYTGEGALCTRPNTVPYWWDATNQTTPSFASHFGLARKYHEGLGLPMVWWQTPLGVSSTAPGGTRGAFRDNRTEYFLTKPQELVAAGAAAVVFSEGHVTQTTIDSDDGQFKRLSTRYFAAPAALP